MTAVARSDECLAPDLPGRPRPTATFRARPVEADVRAAPSAVGLRPLVAWPRVAVDHIRPAAPLATALLTVLVVHVAVAPHLGIGHVTPDVLLTAVVAVAAGRGPRAGAGFGFAAGLGADVFLSTPPGTAALAFTLVGHAIGTARPVPSASRRRGGPAAPGPILSLPARRRWRAEARRGSIRRVLALTALGVGAGRLATAMVATALGGVPFPGPSGLGRITAAAALSAPLGPLALAVVRRLPGGQG